MPLIIPPSVNYPSPLTAVPSLMQDEPIEGRKQVSAEILWATMGGARKSVAINLQNNATLNISQISTLKVDNSQSGADVTFIFPDTSDTIVIPAGTPLAVVPIFSNATQLYISAPLALASDVTRFQLLNYATAPADVPQTTASQTASSGGTVVGGGPVTTQLIAPGINGTLETLQLWFSIATAPVANTQFVISVQDGQATPRVLINSWNVAAPAAVTAMMAPILDFDDLNWRFVNGLVINYAVGGGAGLAIANTFADYHTP